MNQRFYSLDVFRSATVALMILVNNPGNWDQLLALIRINGGIGTDGKPVYLTPFNWFYENVCKQIFPLEPRIGSFVYALCFISMMWFFAWILDKKKIYIKV